jgi:hypothetical protein
VTKWSFVLPIYKEVDLISRTLPSVLALGPTELIIVVDDPVPEGVEDAIWETLAMCGIPFTGKLFRGEALSQETQMPIVKLIRVPRGGEWKYQMAKVRRMGFLEAKNDRIFTGDIDCVVNKNCLKAIDLVGKDNVAMASVTKFHLPKKLIDIYRLIGYGIIKVYIHRIAKKFGASSFSGQYALYKPYWLDTPEELEDAKKMFSVKQKMREGKYEYGDIGLSAMGEDIHMREFMSKKYKVKYLSDIGAFVLSEPYENNPVIQFWKGMYFAEQGRKMLISVLRAIIRGQPHYLVGHLYERRRLRCQKD